jgi:uncharacterized protein YuzE
MIFDNNVYDAKGDVLYLHVGDPADAVDWGGTEEGDGAAYGTDGGLIGLTILNARWRLEQDGKIELTLPEQKFVVTDVGDVFDHPAEYVPDIVTIPGQVEVDGLVFDDAEYDRRTDVLYLRSRARHPVSDGASLEAYHLQFDPGGELAAVTIAEARRLIETEGKVVITLPDGRRLETTDLGPRLAAAQGIPPPVISKRGSANPPMPRETATGTLGDAPSPERE